jgi:hypothetical protein
VWQSPENIAAINSEENDGWPYVAQDGKEMWFTRTYQGSPAIFRSKNVNGEWQDDRSRYLYSNKEINNPHF